jgi:hypothetical protein
MKLYNEDGATCNASKEQSKIMLKAGWSRTVPVEKKVKEVPEKELAKPKVTRKIGKRISK